MKPLLSVSSYGLLCLPLLALTLSCATPTSLYDKYVHLDSDMKQAFLAYYPELTPETRKLFLSEQSYRYSPVTQWKLDSHTYKTAQTGPREFFITDLKFVISKVEIMAPDKASIEIGRETPLKATVYYGDGREADASEDVIWSIEPGLARVDGQNLRFGCVHSDVTVSANFFGERQGSRTFEFRKVLKKLEIRVAENHIAPALGKSGYIAFEAIAHCEDGTSTNVTCQTDWSVTREIGEIDGCGHLWLASPAKRDSKPHSQISVHAQYGEKSALQKVEVAN